VKEAYAAAAAAEKMEEQLRHTFFAFNFHFLSSSDSLRVFSSPFSQMISTSIDPFRRH
jgi:hypothetical protein